MSEFRGKADMAIVQSDFRVWQDRFRVVR